MWTYGTRYEPIKKTELIQYYKVVNTILKELNTYNNNYRKDLILFPEKFDFSRKMLQLNDMYIHKNMKLPCFLDETGECIPFQINFDLLKKKFKLFPVF